MRSGRPEDGELGCARWSVAAVIAAYETATRDRDLRRLFRDVLSFGDPYVSSRGRRRCANAVDLILEVSDAHRRPGSYGLLVRTIRIHASQATATVAVRDGDSQRLERFFLERRAGRWRVAARGCGSFRMQGLRTGIRVKVTRGGVGCGRARQVMKSLFDHKRSRVYGWRCIGPQTGYAHAKPQSRHRRARQLPRVRIGSKNPR